MLPSPLPFPSPGRYCLGGVLWRCGDCVPAGPLGVCSAFTAPAAYSAFVELGVFDGEEEEEDSERRGTGRRGRRRSRPLCVVSMPGLQEFCPQIDTWLCGVQGQDVCSREKDVLVFLCTFLLLNSPPHPGAPGEVPLCCACERKLGKTVKTTTRAGQGVSPSGGVWMYVFFQGAGEVEDCLQGSGVSAEQTCRGLRRAGREPLTQLPAPGPRPHQEVLLREQEGASRWLAAATFCLQQAGKSSPASRPR